MGIFESKLIQIMPAYHSNTNSVIAIVILHPKIFTLPWHLPARKHKKTAANIFQ